MVPWPLGTAKHFMPNYGTFHELSQVNHLNAKSLFFQKNVTCSLIYSWFCMSSKTLLAAVYNIFKMLKWERKPWDQKKIKIKM